MKSPCACQGYRHTVAAHEHKVRPATPTTSRPPRRPSRALAASTAWHFATELRGAGLAPGPHARPTRTRRAAGASPYQEPLVLQSPGRPSRALPPQRLRIPRLGPEVRTHARPPGPLLLGPSLRRPLRSHLPARSPQRGCKTQPCFAIVVSERRRSSFIASPGTTCWTMPTTPRRPSAAAQGCAPVIRQRGHGAPWSSAQAWRVRTQRDLHGDTPGRAVGGRSGCRLGAARSRERGVVRRLAPKLALELGYGRFLACQWRCCTGPAVILH